MVRASATVDCRMSDTIISPMAHTFSAITKIENIHASACNCCVVRDREEGE